MRALHVISGDLWAGAEVQAFTLLTALRRLPGVEVLVAVMNEGELARRLRGHGIQVEVLPESHLSPIQILQGLRRLTTSWRPDIVHTHRIKENILGCLANRLSRNARSVRTTHGAGEHSSRAFSKRILRSLDLWCGMHLQDRVIAVSRELADKLAADFPPAHIAVIENGIDVESVMSQMGPVELPAQSESTTHVGIVGRLVPVKRVDLFLDMAQQLVREDRTRHWHFHVFGDGPLREPLAARARELGIVAQSTFHGHRTDIIACLAALDVLVMCSDHEGLPMTALESLVTGTPLLAHAVGGLSELLGGWADDGLVHTHTASAYAAGCRQLLTRSKAEYRRRCAEAVAQRTAGANAARVLTLYREILNET
jgi:glycosyltransferase involved in cell wall biosynthesis